MILTDTILAISSPPNGGVRGIVRLSGPDAWQLAATIITLPSPPTIGWHANLVLPLLHPTAKLAAALLFQAPRSFTGQDIAELHLPNSPALLKSILAQLLENAAAENIPARLADPGEFSARAFFHGKIDLTQAEGIAATINAANESQLRAAASLRAGDLHHWSAAAAENIAAILALVEAGIDFVEEEDIHFFDPSKVHLQLAALAREIRERLENSTRIDRLDALPTVVFIGKPNVGKSSLINALTGHDRSIVSPIAGTTRDMLAATLHTPAGAIRLLDVPGEESPTDELRQKMMAARENALLDADLIIEVVTAPNDALRPLAEDAQYAAPRARNKADLLPPSRLPTRPTAPYPGEDSAKHDEWHLVSAHTSYGISELRAAIAQRIAHHEPLGAHNIVLNHRHRAILHETRLALLDAAEIARGDAAHQHPELLAAELRRALDILGQMTGAISPDDVLGRIFSHFCIGK